MASGEGTTGNFLAKRKGCTVVGIDVGIDHVSKAIRTSKLLRNPKSAQYLLTLAGTLPSIDASFTATIRERSIGTFQEKNVANELVRLLATAGCLGL